MGNWASQNDIMDALCQYIDLVNTESINERVNIMMILSSVCSMFAVGGNSSASLDSHEKHDSSNEFAVVRVNDLIIGLNLLSPGKKSEKLASSFEFMDEFQMESLSMTQFGRLIKSYLRMLLTLSESLIGFNKEMLEEMADQATAKITAEVFNASTITKHTSLKDNEKLSSRRRVAITFQEFGNWYNSQEENIAQWLQLLDLQKWPGITEALGQLGGDAEYPKKRKALASDGVTTTSDSESDSSDESVTEYFLNSSMGAHIGEYPFVCSLLPPHCTNKDFGGILCALQLSADVFANMITIKKITQIGHHSAKDIIDIFSNLDNCTLIKGIVTASKHYEHYISPGHRVVSLQNQDQVRAGNGPLSVELAKQQKKLQHQQSKKDNIEDKQIEGNDDNIENSTNSFSRHQNSSKSGESLPPAKPFIDRGTFHSLIRSKFIADDIHTSVAKHKHTFFDSFFYFFFDAYSNDAGSSAAINKVSAGLCLFSCGDKNDKLETIFDTFDSDGDGLLSRSELHDFLWSLLMGLVVFSLYTPSSESGSFFVLSCLLHAQLLCIFKLNCLN